MRISDWSSDVCSSDLILTLVVEPVRADLAISDLQISLLQGLSFGLFYAVMGISLGLRADRVSRKRLLIFGIVVWSLATRYGEEAAFFGRPEEHRCWKEVVIQCLFWRSLVPFITKP